MIQTFQIFFPIEKSFPELGERSSQKMLPNVALFVVLRTGNGSESEAMNRRTTHLDSSAAKIVSLQ